jgi:hypothetical protein
LALERELRSRGRKATFRATGQTGIMIAGTGIPIDAVSSDFVAYLLSITGVVVTSVGAGPVIVHRLERALTHEEISAAATAQPTARRRAQRRRATRSRRAGVARGRRPANRWRHLHQDRGHRVRPDESGVQDQGG